MHTTEGLTYNAMHIYIQVRKGADGNYCINNDDSVGKCSTEMPFSTPCHSAVEYKYDETSSNGQILVSKIQALQTSALNSVASDMVSLSQAGTISMSTESEEFIVKTSDQPSKKTNYGLFAARDFEPGEYLGEYCGDYISMAEYKLREARRRKAGAGGVHRYCMAIGKWQGTNMFVDGYSSIQAEHREGAQLQYMNHTQDISICNVVTETSGWCWNRHFKACSEGIREGDELLWDYYKSDNSKTCKKGGKVGIQKGRKDVLLPV